MAARVACAARALTFRARAPRVRGLGTHGVVGDAPRWSNIARCSPPALAFPSSPAPTRRERLPRALPPSHAGARRRAPRQERSPWLAGVVCRALASSAPTHEGEPDDRVEADARISETAPRLGAEIEVDVLVVDEHGGPPVTGSDAMPIEALASALERDARVLASTLVDPRSAESLLNTANDADARADWVALESLARALFPGGPASVSYVELSVALCTDAHIRALNAEWRGKDAATDVLSFPAEAFGEVTVLGDCVVSVDTAARQARDLGHALADECRVLLAHGIAHLAGMDHEDGEEQAREMSRVESALLRALAASDGISPAHDPAGVAKKASERAAPLGLIASAEAGERGAAVASASRQTNVPPAETQTQTQTQTQTKPPLPFPSAVDVDPARRAARRADVLVVDLDGTLLNGDGRVTRRVADALRAAAAKGVLVCVATGKARPAARRALETAGLDGPGGVTGADSPGVFLQGLDVRAPGGGSLASVSMPEEVVRDAFAFHAGEMFGLDTALTAFCGEECHTVGAEPHALLRELASRFHEPRSVPWDDVEQLLAAARAAAGASRGEGDETSETSALRLETSGVSKLLLAAPDAATIGTWRPRWEALLGSRASVTQAVPTMLEVLPVGHDKTTGFEALASRLARESGLAFRSGAETSDDARAVSNDVFERFGRKETDASNELRGSAPFAPLRVVAVGDGENDAGMLRAAGVGVALANACEATKRAADHVTAATNERDGVAEAIRKFVL